ncbi:MAG: beta-galactosidase, partial [Actinomycetota bacterium]|nr:beta-galactosidase [Actinomycetota bacterium]
MLTMKKFSMLVSVFVSVFLIAPAFGAVPAAAPSRERLLMDFGWRFTNGDPADVGDTLDYSEGDRLDKATTGEIAAENLRAASRPDPAAVNLGGTISYVQKGFQDTGWQTLNVPHDWAVGLGFDRTPKVNTTSRTAARFHQSHGFRDMDVVKGTNIGWYRKQFDLPASDAGKTLWVEFDGVYRNSLVWLNGHCLGRYPSGYSSFFYDITKYAQPGEKNTLVVRVDATKWEGWFYEGAGIYRHVWLVKTNPVHVAHWGTFVTTALNGNDAVVTIQTQVRDDEARDAVAGLVSMVTDAEGHTVAESAPSAVTVSAGRQETVTQQVRVRNARLWSLESPTLYHVVSTVRKAGAVVDRYETPFGIRTLKWDPNQGFFLNGRHVVIQGTANHQDHAGVGTAVPDRLNEYRIEQLKRMGCNAYRCAHGPPTPEVLDACDKQGMLVMDETRRMDTTPWAREQLEALVRR